MNENIFKNAKEKYENIKAPKSLRKSVDDIFNEKKKIVFPRMLVSITASALICFVTAININPTFAKSISENEFMRNIISIFTAKKYEVKDNNISANIVTPKITGIPDKEVEEKINNDIDALMQSVIDEFKSGADELKNSFPDAHYGMDAGYIVKTDNDKYLSLDVYVVNTVGSSSTKHKFYNMDKQTGKELNLKDMIKDDNYIEKVAKAVYEEINNRNKLEEHDIYFANYDEIYNILLAKEEFYINENGNPVIVFDKYEIGIGAIGCPEFEIIEN